MDFLDDLPVYEKPPPHSPDGEWSDDDAASISLSGCIAVIVLSFAWIVVYISRNSDLLFEDFTTGEAEQSGWLLVGLMIASTISFLGSVYYFGIRQNPKRWQAVGLTPTTPSWVLGGLFLGVAYLPVNIAIISFVQSLLGQDTLNLSAENARAPVPIVEFLAVFVMASLVVPFAEEIFFRGVIYRWLRQRAGLWIGLGISSLAFGTLHIAIPSIASISILGAVAAILYERSGSLWPAVFVHAGNNAAAILLSYLVLSSQVPV